MKQQLSISTSKEKQIIDLTSKVNQLIEEQNIQEGWGVLFALHTTCSLTTADLDPGTDQDYLQAIDKMFPKGDYNHSHDPTHVGDHIMSSIIGPSVQFPIKNGQAQLGTWQRIVLIELNGPRDRRLVLEVK